NISTLPTVPFKSPFLTADRFYVIFSTHGMQGAPNPSTAGHAWVMWYRHNPQTKISDIAAFGFYPDYEIVDKKVGKMVGRQIIRMTAIPTSLQNSTLPGKLVGLAQVATGSTVGHVPGKMQDDLATVTTAESLKQVVVEVDEVNFQKSLHTLQNYFENTPQYKGIEQDCATFFIDVGRSIGLQMPNRSITDFSSWLPDSYMDVLMKSLTTPNKIPVETSSSIQNTTQTGNATANINGEYKVDFGSPSNYNSCVLNSYNNLIENRIRNGNITCQQVNFPNGDTWYSEPPKSNDFGIPVTNPDGSSFRLPPIATSEYRFSNGNTILAYNPNSFNPNFAPVNLSTGKDTYLGAISTDGTPNGNGTLTHMEFDKSGWMTSTSKTGIFIDGQFKEYTGVSNDVGTIYGEYKNGNLEGPVRIEYYDGRVFTGTFVNGKANGQGTTTNKNNGYYLSAEFKDGQANGYGSSKNQFGLYKGEFKNGECNGNGTWWNVNGNLCEGVFVNGRMVSGKTTIPSGNYYIGTYDQNGKPNGGKYYDKNGKEIKERDSYGGGGDRDRTSKSGDYTMKIGDGPTESFTLGDSKK
ncbi:MAG: hypothetical protein JNL23_08365, partial [Chitinophagaceae bacterium]|nr:hypothetical protein [Chitinophagaceae bacterium]